MKIFGFELTQEIQYILVLILVLCWIALIQSFQYHSLETFTTETGCKVVGVYSIEKCGNDVKTNTIIKNDEQPPPPLPAKECPFPTELHELGCQLKCPTNAFLFANPSIECQRIISGENVKSIDGKCPDGYIVDTAGCIKKLTNCPQGYEFIEGTCHEKCPTGTTSTFREVEIDNNGVIEKRNTRVCQMNPSYSN
jgi:hypothetical protein